MLSYARLTVDCSLGANVAWKIMSVFLGMLSVTSSWNHFSTTLRKYGKASLARFVLIIARSSFSLFVSSSAERTW